MCGRERFVHSSEKRSRCVDDADVRRGSVLAFERERAERVAVVAVVEPRRAAAAARIRRRCATR
jgi:hypothetical protein